MSINTKDALGVMGRGPGGTKISQITDGLSNTITIAECANRPKQYVSGKPALNPSPSSSSYNTDSLSDGWGWADINSGFSVDGANQAGLQNTTSSNGTPTINGSCLINCTNDSEIYSPHTGLVIVLLADGSVKSISSNTSGVVVTALISRANGEVVGEF